MYAKCGIAKTATLLSRTASINLLEFLLWKMESEQTRSFPETTPSAMAFFSTLVSLLIPRFNRAIIVQCLHDALPFRNSGREHNRLASRIILWIGKCWIFGRSLSFWFFFCFFFSLSTLLFIFRAAEWLSTSFILPVGKCHLVNNPLWSHLYHVRVATWFTPLFFCCTSMFCCRMVDFFFSSCLFALTTEED